MIKKPFLVLALMQVSFLSGCATTFVCNPIQKADRIPLIPMSETAWESMNQEAQDTVTHNDLALKEMIRMNEVNIEAHNEVCQ